MKSSREIAVLLLVATGLSLVPVPMDAACDLSAPAAVDPCDASLPESCCGSACGGEPIPGDDDGCETGCQHCSMPCCSGTAMIPTAVQALDAAFIADRRLAARGPDETRVDVDPLYHPPRS